MPFSLKLSTRVLACMMVCGALALGSRAMAVDAAAQPAPPSGEVAPPLDEVESNATPIIIEITGVEGIVQARPAEGKPWEPAKVGMKLDQGAEFRTGPRSAVRFIIPPDQVVTLDRLGTVKVVQAIRDAGLVKTDLGMKYGRTRYDIEAAGLEHDSSIHSPSTTLSIRGTQVSLYDQPPYLPEAVNLRGLSKFKVGQGALHTLGAGGAGKADAKHPDAGSMAMSTSVADPGNPLARNGAESDVISQMPSLGAMGMGPMPAGSFQTLASNTFTVPTHLLFNITWAGMADVDTFVISPLHEGLSAYPDRGIPGFGGTPARSSPSGGNIPFDNTNSNGFERAEWLKAPTGVYTVGGVVYSGGPATVTITATLNGKPLGVPFISTVNSEGDYTQTQFTVPPASNAKAAAPRSH